MKHLSVKENHLFGKAYSGGKRFAGRYVAVYILRDRAARRLMKANPEKKYLNRVGVSVGKKLGGAVTRNRLRRIIREGFRELENESNIKTGYIIIISARAGAVGKKSTDIGRELRYAFGKLGMFAGENQRTL